MNLDPIFHILKEQGCRRTPLRVALLELLADKKEPLSAPQIMEALEQMGKEPNLTTLYRQLDTLVEHGVVDLVRIDPKVQLFELKHEHHHHFVCGECKDVQDVHSEAIESAFAAFEKELQRKGLNIQKHELTFFGACQSCH